MTGFDIFELNSAKHETNTHSVSDTFESISIENTDCDINFARSESGECQVICQELVKTPHSVSVENGTLTIRRNDTRKWFDYIGIFWGKTSITVYLPKEEYSSLKIETDVGDVDIPDSFRFKNIDIDTDTGDVKIAQKDMDLIAVSTDTGDISISSADVSGNLRVSTVTGKIKLSSISCTSITAGTDTGDITFDDLIAAENMELESDTGDIRLNRCDAGSIDIETDTGDVEGSLLSDKIFFTETDTGDVSVPKSTVGGRCEISTDTGDIEFTIIT